MVLSEQGIKQRLSDGRIDIYPVNRFTIGPNGIDLSVDRYFYRQDWKRFNAAYPDACFDPSNNGHIKALWQLSSSLTHAEMTKEYLGQDLRGFPASTLFIPVMGGERIMAITVETLCHWYDTVAYFVTKSTLARYGWQFCACSNQGNVNSHDKIVLEVTNMLAGPSFLVVGDSVIQASFELLDPPVFPRYVEPAKNYWLRWTPDDMLRVYQGNRH